MLDGVVITHVDGLADQLESRLVLGQLVVDDCQHVEHLVILGLLQQAAIQQLLGTKQHFLVGILAVLGGFVVRPVVF